MDLKLKVSEEMTYVIEIISREEYIDEKTVLRRIIYEGIKEYVLDFYSKGKISLSKCAEVLSLSVHDVLRLARREGISIGATKEQQIISEKTAKIVL